MYFGGRDRQCLEYIVWFKFIRMSIFNLFNLNCFLLFVVYFHFYENPYSQIAFVAYKIWKPTNNSKSFKSASKN